jgi:fucose permease
MKWLIKHLGKYSTIYFCLALTIYSLIYFYIVNLTPAQAIGYFIMIVTTFITGFGLVAIEIKRTDIIVKEQKDRALDK